MSIYSAGPPHEEHREFPRHKMYYIIYISVFGAVWAIGTGVLAGALPPEPLTRVIIITWFETLILVLCKLVLLKRFSVTAGITIAATLSVFTFSFGPPNPFKSLFLLAGLAFDLGTFLRTANLKRWNMILGWVFYIPVIFGVFALVLYLVDPDLLVGFWAAAPLAAGVYTAEGVIITLIIWPFINPDRAPVWVHRIRARIRPPQ